MIYILYFILFCVMCVIAIWGCICVCISCRHCVEQWGETWMTCYDTVTKKRAVVVHPIEATVVTYIGDVEIENGN